MDYFSFTIIFTISIYIFHMYIQMRQHKKYLVKSLPDYLSSKVTELQFQKTQEYNKDKSKFKFFTLSYDLVISLFFLFYIFEIFSFAKSIAFELLPMDSIGHRHDIMSSLVFVTMLILAGDLIDIPPSLFQTFVIEQRHGFNKTDWHTFWTDKAKMCVLKIVAGLPIVSIIILLIENTGPAFPILISLFLFAVKLLLLTIYPTLIQPCFNKCVELENGELKTAIEDLAKRINFPLKKLFSMDGSKRSSHSNAYLYGFCNNKRIVLFDTLIKQCSKDEIIAILGHELGHWKMSHTLKLFAFVEGYSFFIFYLMSFFLYSESLYSSFGFQQRTVFIGVTLYFIVMGPIDAVRDILMNSITRAFEFQADLFSKKLGNAESLKSGLMTLAKENKIGLVDDPLYSLYYHSHPPMLERIKRL